MFGTKKSGALAALTVATSIALLTPRHEAQCFIPDGLTAPCWQLVNLKIPQLPPVNLEALGICWTNCNPTTNCNRLAIGPPTMTNICGEYSAQVDVFDCSGAPLMRGIAVLDYTRTWMEATPIDEYQVWRFTLKVDLGPATTALVCPMPTCLAGNPDGFFYGYIDYAQPCSIPGGPFEVSTVMFHNCDSFIHQQGLSSRPGTWHPATTYAIVAPHTPANPFMPMDNPRFGGPLVGEAMRNVTNPFGVPMCTAEEVIVAGILQPLIQLCMCPINFGSIHNSFSLFSGTGSCPDVTGVPSSFAALNFFPQVPWLYMLSTNIGCWTTDATYPGKECVWVDEGLFAYYDGCANQPGMTGIAKSADIFYGASTLGGWPIIPTSPLLPPTDKFIDMASNYSHKLGSGPIALPILGSVFKTDHLIYANTP